MTTPDRFFKLFFMNDIENRRPLETRKSKWAQNLAALLARHQISPNTISLASIVFSIIALWMYYLAVASSLEWLCLLLAAVGIELSLLCNVLDGMLAIEHRRRGKLGVLYNELPERVSDILIILGAGLYSLGQPYAMSLAWCAALLATMTAYLRILGAYLGTPQFFVGPMAQPHRMNLIAGITLLQMFLPSIPLLYFSLYLMIAGLLVTCFRRLRKISETLTH